MVIERKIGHVVDKIRVEREDNNTSYASIYNKNSVGSGKVGVVWLE